MNERIKLIGYDGKPTVEVDCFPTCSEYFVLTRDPRVCIPPNAPAWCLTHVRSTCRLIGPFATRAEVRLMAAIFAALPVSWPEFTPKIGTNGKHREKDLFAAEWGRLPEEIRKWRSEVNLACEEYLDSIVPEDDGQL